MKKILITGLTGFIGSWLALLLFSKKYKVYGISLKNLNPLHVYNKTKVSKYCKSYICDIQDYNKLSKIFHKIKPDIVIHLAAQPLVIKSYYDPFNTFYTNILGTLNIFKLASKFSSGKIVNFTSDKVYHNLDKNITFKESDTLHGNDPYSLSKACSDLIGQNMNRETGLNKLHISTIRSGNIIGGGDWQEYRILTDYYKALLKNKILTIRQPHSIRPWQHVINPIYIIYQIIKKDQSKFYGTFNISPNKNIYNVKYIINELNKLNKEKKIEIKYKNLYKFKESKILKLNNTKSKKTFKYPKSNLKIDLLNTNNWYINSFEKKNMTNYSLNQIYDYIK